ncbi:MAG: diguanylate cyclase, partial [Lysinibacillus sp.]
EFAIIYPEADELQLTQLGHQIVAAVSEKCLEHIQHPDSYVTISAGGYTMTVKDSFTSKKQLIIASDERLYEAKHNGRNQFVGPLT